MNKPRTYLQTLESEYEYLRSLVEEEGLMPGLSVEELRESYLPEAREDIKIERIREYCNSFIKDYEKYMCDGHDAGMYVVCLDMLKIINGEE